MKSVNHKECMGDLKKEELTQRDTEDSQSYTEKKSKNKVSIWK